MNKVNNNITKDNVIISLNKITKTYSSNIGVFDINIQVSLGEVYGFIGPNGAGKTTTIRQMVGFIKTDQGNGTILGYDIWKNTEDIMKDLGYVSGENMILDYLTGIKYLKICAQIRKNVEWNYVEKLINYFELNAKIKIKKMSKGMKQKVALIAAIMHKPKVLILDEPTSGLDPLMQEKFQKIIKDFKNNGTTIFLSSHIFSEVQAICDRIAFIKAGRIVSEISIAEMKEKSDKVYEIKFKSINDLNNFLINSWNIEAINKETKIIKVTIPSPEINKFLKNIAQFELDSYQELPYNLESHFLKFYGGEVDVEL